MNFWFELGKLAASIATPVVVAVLGVFLLRRIEGVKALVAKESDFHKRWADEFFSCCQQFMQTLERFLALLKGLASLQEKNGKRGTEIQEELRGLSVRLSELELRLRRCVVFAPKAGVLVKQTAEACIALTASLVKSMEGDFDPIIDKMNEFNGASRKAHFEMLGLNDTDQGAPADARQATRRSPTTIARMPHYSWSCLACGSSNGKFAGCCGTCGCPSPCTVQEIESCRASYLATGATVGPAAGHIR